jgi:hypothetical protein
MEISLHVGNADMLEHSDACNFVISIIQGRVILELDGYAVFKTEPFDLLPGIVDLFLEQGDTVRPDTMVPGGMADDTLYIFVVARLIRGLFL